MLNSPNWTRGVVVRPLAALTLVATIAVPATIAAADGAKTANSRPAPARSVVVAATAGVGRLVDDGTITRQQADSIDRQITTGSIDPKQLVDGGIVTEPQMRAVADVITAVKRSGG